MDLVNIKSPVALKRGTQGSSAINIVIVDVDGLVVDVNSLLIAVGRSVFNTKMNMDDFEDGNACSLQDVAIRVMTNCNARNGTEDRTQIGTINWNEILYKQFINTSKEYAALCRPYFGACRCITQVKEVFGDNVVFSTCKPEMTTPCLLKLLGYASDVGLYTRRLQCDGDCTLKTEGRCSHVVWLMSTSAQILNTLVNNGKRWRRMFKEPRTVSICLMAKSWSFVTLCEKLLTPQKCISMELFVVAPRQSTSTDAQGHTRHEKRYILRTLDELPTDITHHLFNLKHKEFLEPLQPKSQLVNLPPLCYVQKVTPLVRHGPPRCAEVEVWDTHVLMRHPIVFDGVVVKGYGRGGSTMGIPTANLSVTVSENGESLPFPGVYFGFCVLFEKHQNNMCATPSPVYDMILSAGYNPYYNNDYFVVEPHLFATFPNDFLGARLRIAIVGLLRPEANFPRFEHLLQAIQNDCEVVRDILTKIHKLDDTQYKQCCALLKGRCSASL